MCCSKVESQSRSTLVVGGLPGEAGWWAGFAPDIAWSQRFGPAVAMGSALAIVYG